MPSLPLYAPNVARPDASHAVLAPGGYERWYFDAETPGGELRVVATFAQGWLDHPDYADYLRRYDRYLRRPTRNRPPVPGEYPSISLAVYEQGRDVARFTHRLEPDQFRASTGRLELSAENSSVNTETDGSIRLRLTGTAPGPSAELILRPLLTQVPGEIQLLSREKAGSEHCWVTAKPRCAVEGTFRIDGGARVIPFSGRGYHDHHYGTAPVPRVARWWLRGRVLTDGGVIAFGAAGGSAVDAADELRCVEADGAGVRETAAPLHFGPSGYPEVIELKAAGVRLSNPRVLDRAAPGIRLLYEVATSRAGGSCPHTALCELHRY